MTEQARDRQVPSKVVCPAAKDPVVRLFIFAAILIGFGIWCFVDGYLKEGPPREDLKGINQVVTWYLNHVGGIVLPIAGIVPLVWGLLFLRRRLLADEEGLGYAGKEKVPWTAVKSLDTSRLASKGILTLHYESSGQEGTLVLDGWKLQNFRDLVALVERKVAPGGG
jgi:hypothetical protein